MDDLPDLPFVQVLGHLGLPDLIRCRAVSKRWHQKIDSIRVSSLFFSEWPKGHIVNKSRLVVAEFVHNYISTPEFEWFFGQFGGSLLSQLAHLRVCDLCLNRRSPAFIAIVNSFGGSLKCLDLVRVESLCQGSESNFELNLPNLQRIRLEHSEISGLTLNAPRLAELKAWYLGESRLAIVHGESLESVLADKEYFDVRELKNLQFFSCRVLVDVGDTLLAELEQLKEIHLNGDENALKRLHGQKRSYSRTHLKIFYLGLCTDSAFGDIGDSLNGDSPSGNPGLNEALLNRMLANYSTLAGELPLYQHLDYSEIEPAFSRVPTEFWARLTNLEKIYVNKPVRNVEHFLSFLRNCDKNVRTLIFYRSHPQRLFDQLLVHCQTVQFLEIYNYAFDRDFTFLLTLPNLIDLFVGKIQLELVRKIFETLKFIRGFWFQCAGQDTFIKRDRSKQFSLRFQGRRMVFAEFDALFAYLNTRRRS